MKNFITFEGCDGVGKSFQINLLKDYCKKHSLNNVIFTREPGGSAVSEKIRNIILDAKNDSITDLCEAFLYAASRAQHVEEVILPALEQGKVVICDRFVDSSYVYQGVGRGLGMEKVVALNALAVGNCMPQYTVFLDLPPKQAFLRKGGVDKADRLETTDMSFHEALYDAYKKLIKTYPERFIVIDASGTIAQTQEKIIRALTIRNVI